MVSFAKHGRSRLQSFPRKRESTRGPRAGTGVVWSAVIPAQAGIHCANARKCAVHGLDSRLRGNDRRLVRDDIPNDTTTIPRLPCFFGEGCRVDCELSFICVTRRFLKSSAGPAVRSCGSSLAPSRPSTRAIRSRKFPREFLPNRELKLELCARSVRGMIRATTFEGRRFTRDGENTRRATRST